MVIDRQIQVRKRLLRISVFCITFYVMLCTGCVHRSPFVSLEETYFQAMGDPAEFVLTVDMEKAQPLYADAAGAMQGVAADMVGKAERISVALHRQEPETEEDALDLPYPAELSSFDLYGGIEGDYSKFIINTALMYAKNFTTLYEGDVKYFKSNDGGFSLGMPKNGLILFSSDDWKTVYQKTWADRQLRIPVDMAARMEGSVLGIYVSSPRTMISLGFDIPITVVLQMDEALFLVSYDEQDRPVLDASLKMKSSKLANSLSMLIRSQYVAQLRRDGVQFNMSELKDLFVTNEEFFVINSMPLTTTQLESVTASFDTLLQNLGGLM
ncbi:MAG: hypothetical protein SPD11_10525 [Sphaerochaetaceae bacterium]|nr:hypothetical protein [Sphaerochaetaceae bacterium]